MLREWPANRGVPVLTVGSLCQGLSALRPVMSAFGLTIELEVISVNNISEQMSPCNGLCLLIESDLEIGLPETCRSWPSGYAALLN